MKYDLLILLVSYMANISYKDGRFISQTGASGRHDKVYNGRWKFSVSGVICVEAAAIFTGIMDIHIYS
jgi:hypothetical protein